MDRTPGEGRSKGKGRERERSERYTKVNDLSNGAIFSDLE